jgi:tight adherence protein C
VGVVESTKHRLELTGSLEAVGVDVYLAVKFLFPVGFLFLLILLSIFLTMPLILKIILMVLIPLSYFFPDIYLRGRINKRQKEIRKTLPDALDMLTISVEAGIGFDVALYRLPKILGEFWERNLIGCYRRCR